MILLSVRRRIHCGVGRFCFCFFASVRFVAKVLCDDIYWISRRWEERVATGDLNGQRSAQYALDAVRIATAALEGADASVSPRKTLVLTGCSRWTSDY